MRFTKKSAECLKKNSNHRSIRVSVKNVGVSGEVAIEVSSGTGSPVALRWWWLLPGLVFFNILISCFDSLVLLVQWFRKINAFPGFSVGVFNWSVDFILALVKL